MRKQHYTVDWVDNGADADFVLRTETYDLVLLDLALPKLGGHEVLRRLRERGNAHAGARADRRQHHAQPRHASSITAPTTTSPSRSRSRSSRRASACCCGARRTSRNPQIACGDLVYLGGSREFTLGGKPLTLTPRERTVLEVLVMKAGTTVSKAALGQSLPSLEDGVSADAIEIYVHRLRKKLEGSDATIVTLRGMGYVLRPVHHGA